MESLSFAITHFILQFNKLSQWEINQQTFMLQPEISAVICIKGKYTPGYIFTQWK